MGFDSLLVCSLLIGEAVLVMFGVIGEKAVPQCLLHNRQDMTGIVCGRITE